MTNVALQDVQSRVRGLEIGRITGDCGDGMPLLQRLLHEQTTGWTCRAEDRDPWQIDSTSIVSFSLPMSGLMPVPERRCYWPAAMRQASLCRRKRTKTSVSTTASDTTSLWRADLTISERSPLSKRPRR